MNTQERLSKVEQAPLHTFLGVKLVDAQPGSARIELVAGPQALNPAGWVHGGVIYSIGDAAAYAAILGHLSEQEEAVTHDLHVSVMKPVPAGSTLRFDATVERKGKTLAFINVRATVNDTLVATLRVTKSLITLR